MLYLAVSLGPGQFLNPGLYKWYAGYIILHMTMSLGCSRSVPECLRVCELFPTRMEDKTAGRRPHYNVVGGCGRSKYSGILELCSVQIDC